MRPFNEYWIRAIAEFRIEHNPELLISVFQAITWFGSSDAYFVLFVILFLVFNKEKAYKLSMLTLTSYALNTTLKSLIMNPRPFVTTGETEKFWATNAEFYSTPSGHAQISSSTLYGIHKEFELGKWKWIVLLLGVLIGISRPFLGVHYVEDIIIGWAVGIAITILYMRYYHLFAGLGWKRLLIVRVTFATGGFFLALLLMPYDNGIIEMTSALGSLLGVWVGRLVEQRHIRFSEAEGTMLKKITRAVVGVGIVFAILIGLDLSFAMLAEDLTALGLALRFIRYFIVVGSAFSLVPMVLIKLKLLKESSVL